MTKRKHLKRRVRDRATKTGESYTAALRHLRSRAQEAPMSSTAPNKLAVDCSFCSKSNNQVKKLIAGPGVYICDECIGLCNAILEDESKDAAESQPPALDDAPLERLLMIFGAMARSARSMEDRLVEWARKLAQRGVPVSSLATKVEMSESETVVRFNL